MGVIAWASLSHYRENLSYACYFLVFYKTNQHLRDNGRSEQLWGSLPGQASFIIAKFLAMFGIFLVVYKTNQRIY